MKKIVKNFYFLSILLIFIAVVAVAIPAIKYEDTKEDLQIERVYSVKKYYNQSSLFLAHIDGHQYLLTAGYYGLTGIIHKENCDNPIHKTSK